MCFNVALSICPCSEQQPQFDLHCYNYVLTLDASFVVSIYKYVFHYSF